MEDKEGVGVVLVWDNDQTSSDWGGMPGHVIVWAGESLESSYIILSCRFFCIVTTLIVYIEYFLS